MATTPPAGYDYDQARILLGHGDLAFYAACQALRSWTQFDLGWTAALPRDTPIETDRCVAVVARALGLWTLNAARIVYVVTAAPRTKLELYTWWFPVIGRVAYKGYFHQSEAKLEAQRLEAQGYDTYIRPALAFSTLGWFSDPLLPHLLKYDGETLANIIIHELFHTTFYLKGQSAFNESLANFVGHRGIIAFLTKEQGSEAAATRKAVATWKSELAIADFLSGAAERLNTLYDSTLSEGEKLQQREQVFTQVQEEFRRLPVTVRRNVDLATITLNNAVILQYLVYLRELTLFERVYQENGQDLRATLEKVTQTARKSDDPFIATRALVVTPS